MYKKLQLGLFSVICGGVWYNIYYQTKNINLNTKEEIETMDQYSNIII
jgi:hypothetical protein